MAVVRADVDKVRVLRVLNDIRNLLVHAEALAIAAEELSRGLNDDDFSHDIYDVARMAEYAIERTETLIDYYESLKERDGHE